MLGSKVTLSLREIDEDAKITTEDMVDFNSSSNMLDFDSICNSVKKIPGPNIPLKVLSTPSKGQSELAIKD